MKVGFDVAVLHDFFVDRFVSSRDPERLFRQMGRKRSQGGGSIIGVTQEDIAGGNAVNLARAAARLGLRTLLVTHTDREHEQLLRASFVGLNASVVAKKRPPGLTVAFEGRANVMLGDARGAGSFGPSLLSSEDWRSISGAKMVCAVNWVSNRDGSDLLRSLRGRLGRGTEIFFDAADFRPREEEFGRLLREIRLEDLVDVISMNEVEARRVARLVGLKGGSLGEICVGIAAWLGASVDVHGAEASFTSQAGGIGLRTAETKRVVPRRLTGAGDVWNAASVFGRIKGMQDEERLRFANEAARFYVAAPSPLAPMLGDVMT